MADKNTTSLNNNTDKSSINENKNSVNFTYPACWQDDSKMQVLMSNFHLRELNPRSYDSKMKFWIDLIMEYCLHRGKVNFCKKELQIHFARGEKIPACLDTVLQYMQQQKIIRQRTEFEYDPADTWSGWAVNIFVKKPLTWSWEKLRNSIIKEDQNRESLKEWIHLLVLRKLCNDLETKVIEQNRGKILHFDGFKSICNNFLNIEDTTLAFCIRLLSCKQKIGLEYKQESQTQRIHIIKIPSLGNPNINITESDVAMHNLQMTQANLLKQLETLEDEIKINDDKSRLYIKENKRQLAKAYLRKRHLLEKVHEKRGIALHNIETLISSLEETENNGEVLDAYKYGSKALQNALNESGLKYDNINEVLANVQDTLEQTKEVQDAISNSSLIESSYADDDLERELSEIMGEADNSLHENNTNDNNLPKVSKNNNDTQQVVITDEELLKMLDSLDVEDHSILNPNREQIIS